MILLGIDAQPRGLAIAEFSLETSQFKQVHWLEMTTNKTIEDTTFEIFSLSREILPILSPSIVYIELPAAMQSSSTMHLWCICGALIASSRLECTIVKGIVPTSWKKHSGLNRWAKENSIDKRGTIQKSDIPRGVTELAGLELEEDLSPKDLYDSIGIGLAGVNLNKELLDKMQQSNI